jgi:prolipoprotein diacylglyceryltransferase
VGRFLVENLRIDPATSGGGLRLNQWIALVAFVGAMLYLIVDSRRPVAVAAPASDTPAGDQPSDTQNGDTA